MALSQNIKGDDRSLMQTVRALTALVAMAAMTLPGAAGAADSFVGNIRAIESDIPKAYVKIVRTGYSGLIEGRPGDAVFLGDTVKTGAGIKARIGLSDGSTVILAQNSSVQMKGHLADRSQGKRNSVMRAFKGTVRFVISRIFKSQATGAEIAWKDSAVTVETMNAVAGVRGTDFAVSVARESDEIAVLDGAVSVKSSSPTVNNGVMLGADQITRVMTGKSPEPPSTLTPERKEELLRATTLEKPETTSDAKGPKPIKGKKYEEKAMARDMAAGIPLGDILDRAVASGMSIGEVMDCALDAGVDPAVLVYTAITEGYSAKEIVTAAVEYGTPLKFVLPSALAAGADKKLVISGALDAGVPPGVIANAVANGTSTGAPVYGSSLLIDSTPSAVIPTPPAAISGGGGATPSTQPASPYRP